MGVALLNAQSDASAQGGDLEHTGHTFFSTVSANLHIGLVPLDKGLHAETNLWPCSGLAWWATGELSSDQHSGWQNLANGRQ